MNSPPPKSAAQMATATSTTLTATALHAPMSPPGKRYGRGSSASEYFNLINAKMTDACSKGGVFEQAWQALERMRTHL